MRAALRALSGGREARAWNSSTLTGMGIPVRSAAGVRSSLSADQVMSLGAVYACLRFISDTISCMAVDVIRSVDGRSIPATKPEIVATPSPRPQVTAAAWLYQVIWSGASRGNTFGLVTSLGPAGWPKRIDLLDPAQVEYRCRAGVEQWWVTTETGKRTEVTLWQDGGTLWHVPFGALPGQTIGMDVISRAAVDLGIAHAARQYGADWFWSGGHPTAVLQSDQQLTAEQATATQRRWVDALLAGGREPRVVGSGLKYQPLQVTPDQAALLGVLQASTADVCRWFGVPPEEIGGTSGGSLTYANVEARGMQALAKLTPMIRTVQDAWSALIPDPLQVRLVAETLLMTNASTKASILQGNVKAGIITANEARALLDLPPIAGGDTLTTTPDPPTRGADNGNP